MIALFGTLLFLISLAHAQSNPNDLVCENTAITASQWARFFETNQKFNGFFAANGTLEFKEPGFGTSVVSVPIAGALWRQYYNAENLQIGELYLPGYLFGVPQAPLVLVSRQVTNPILSGLKLCQKFVEPSAANFLNSYSELVAHGKNYMESKYFSLESATFMEVPSNEWFSFSSDSVRASSQTISRVLGNGAAHFINQIVTFYYTAITEQQATAMGWAATNVASVTSSRGLHGPRAVLPVTLLSEEQRTRVGL